MRIKQLYDSKYLLIFLDKESDEIFDFPYIAAKHVHYDIILCTHYNPPPTIRAEQISPSPFVLIKSKTFHLIQKQLKSKKQSSLNLYWILKVYFDNLKLNRFYVFENGKPKTNNVASKDFSCVIPHKGDLKLLYRCLEGLKRSKVAPKETLIYFDDNSYSSFKQPKGLNFELKLFKNNPPNQGPYSARNHGCLNSTFDLIIHHDSDDLSLDKRCGAVVYELSNTDADVVGTQELRINDIEQSVKIVKYPIDVNKAWNDKYTFAQLHPTTGISKKSYIDSGGFSTHLTFALDTQFQMRAFLKGLKFRNVDEVLYVRFIRNNSLTTNCKIGLNSNIRSKILQSWNRDFCNIQSEKIKLENSSLIKIDNFNLKEPLCLK